MRNFHLPLPDGVYLDLHEEAARSGRPATALARQAIAMFAAENAGSPMDHDAELEAASIEHLLATNARKD